MTTRFDFQSLDVVGFIGQLDTSAAPARLMPVYVCSSSAEIVLPPLSESEGNVRGHAAPKERLNELVDEQEVTCLPSPEPAKPTHLLWMSPEGPRYESRERAEEALEQLAEDAIREVCALGLREDGACDLLFKAYRVRTTAVVCALLSVHFQLRGDPDQGQPLQKDLRRLAGKDTGRLERRLLDAAAPLLASSREVAAAVAREIRRAERDDLAEEILDEHVRHVTGTASEPAPAIGQLEPFRSSSSAERPVRGVRRSRSSPARHLPRFRCVERRAP
jgi:hypothetical protein